MKNDARREVAIARFHFNAWAKYPDWKKDDRVPERAARALGIPLRPVAHDGQPVVLEGGSIDVDGRGTLLTTEECNLDPVVQVRNPGLARDGFERVVRDALGATKVLWLGAGIAGDDTHGHVDDLARFVSPTRVLLCRETDPADVNYRPLEENRERLQGARNADGERIEVVPLPMPRPLILDGQRLPASYANFYVANGPSSCQPSTIPRTGRRSGSWPSSSPIARWSASTPSIWCGGWAPCTASASSSRRARRLVPERVDSRSLRCRRRRRRRAWLR